MEHPLVLTEAPCNPLHCRQMMSELLFECYGVPRVAYGVDSLFSFYHNSIQSGLDRPHTGLVLSSGYHCSHVLPFVNGRYRALALVSCFTQYFILPNVTQDVLVHVPFIPFTHF